MLNICFFFFFTVYLLFRGGFIASKWHFGEFWFLWFEVKQTRKTSQEVKSNQRSY